MSYLIKKLLPILFSFLALSLWLVSCSYQEVKVIGIEGVKVKNVSAKGIELEATIQISNPNNYKISIVGSDLDLFIKNKKVGKAKITKKVVIHKNSNETHLLTIKSSFKEAAGGAVRTHFAQADGDQGRVLWGYAVDRAVQPLRP